MRKKALIAIMPALLAAPSLAHVVEWALPAFLSRCSTTAEATLTDFTTFKLEETILIVR